MFSSSKRPQSHPPTQPQSSAPPKDALAALMEGDTPDKKSLRFPDERSDSFQQPGNRGGRFEEYKGDHSFDRKPQRSQGDYDYQPAQSGAFDSVKQGAAKSGKFVTDKSTAGVNYVKEKDWTKEKEMAGKAGQATKSGAFFVGSGVAKGAGWLWKSGKSGVDSLKGSTGPAK